jgi:hypothetical protein
MSIAIQFRPTKRDVMRAAYLGLQLRPIVFFLCISFFVILPWVTVAMLLAEGLHGIPIKPTDLTWPALVPLATIAYFRYVIVMPHTKSLGLTGPHHYEFSESAIQVSGPGFDRVFDWSKVTACHSFRDGLIFRSKRLPLIIVPAHAVTSQDRVILKQLLEFKGIRTLGRW